MNMKKLVSMLVAAALVCTMSTTAFAADQTGVNTGEYSNNVKGTYQAGGAAATVYSVNIAWDSLEFTYTAAGEGTWNPETHEYNGATQASWSESKNIVVTNHSNAAVTATASFQADGGYEAVSMTFGNNGQQISSAVDTAVDSAPNLTISVTPSGDLPADTNGTIGSVTLTIAAAE
jgi:hypothetical protein